MSQPAATSPKQTPVKIISMERNRLFMDSPAKYGDNRAPKK